MLAMSVWTHSPFPVPRTHSSTHFNHHPRKQKARPELPAPHRAVYPQV